MFICLTDSLNSLKKRNIIRFFSLFADIILHPAEYAGSFFSNYV
jgi:hypothetical protein